MEQADINNLNAKVDVPAQQINTASRVEYIIPGQVGIDKLLAQLKEKTRLVSEPVRNIKRTYYDTFDWRLNAQNAVLEVQQVNRQRLLLWRNLDGKSSAQISLNTAPAFAKDLPSGKFRDQLEKIIEMRELVPLLQVGIRARSLRILNKNEKTVVRLVIEESSVRRSHNGRAQPLGSRVAVLPVKGYQKHLAKVVNILESLGLTPAIESSISELLTLVGHTPGDYSSKLDLHLSPDLRADEATRLVLKRLFEIILANEAGTKAGTDTEFLHDFRVSVRRTRSALSQIKGVLPTRTLGRYKTEFAWLGKITGPMRDLDVYLLQFDEYRDSLPVSARADLEPLRDFLLRQQKTEHEALVKALESARYRRLVEGWRKFLDQPINERSTLKNARKPILAVARQRIWKTYRGIIKEGQAIKPDTPAEALHELRKTGKKLRYLMEFFQSVFPPEEIKELIKILKLLQENLGDFQDYEVQVMTLKLFSQRMVAEGGVPTETLLAMGMLIEGLERRQQKARNDFANCFAHFALAENRLRFRALFKPPAATSLVSAA